MKFQTKYHPDKRPSSPCLPPPYPHPTTPKSRTTVSEVVPLKLPFKLTFQGGRNGELFLYQTVLMHLVVTLRLCLCIYVFKKNIKKFHLHNLPQVGGTDADNLCMYLHRNNRRNHQGKPPACGRRSPPRSPPTALQAANLWCPATTKPSLPHPVILTPPTWIMLMWT